MAEIFALPNSRAVSPAVREEIELVGVSSGIARVRELLRRSALLDTPVLIVAERGADVASVARELHGLWRPDAPLVIIESSALDAARLDRLLFGVPRGRTTSDVESVVADSRIAAARGGTLFLQDVSELPAAIQARLARVARDGEVRIDNETVPTELRLVASATPAIDSDVRENRFRLDLFRRLSASRIDLPPLRDRLDDVPALAARLLEELTAGAGLPARSFTQAALALLAALNWPGNLAELRGAVERVVGETPGGAIQIEQLLPALHLDRAHTAFMPSGSLRDARLRFERDYIASVLQHHGWRMAEAAQTLGIQRPNLYRKARQLGIPLSRATE
jgi:DNA-binding NtrC family response regulator